MEKKPNKKDELSVVNNVLKLAMKLMKVSQAKHDKHVSAQNKFNSKTACLWLYLPATNTRNHFITPKWKPC